MTSCSVSVQKEGKQSTYKQRTQSIIFSPPVSCCLFGYIVVHFQEVKPQQRTISLEKYLICHLLG